MSIEAETNLKYDHLLDSDIAEIERECSSHRRKGDEPQPDIPEGERCNFPGCRDDACDILSVFYHPVLFPDHWRDFFLCDKHMPEIEF